MDTSSLLIIILAIISFDFVFERILDFLNMKSQRDDIPESMSDFYNEEKYKKSQAYYKTSAGFSFVTSTFSFVLSFALLALGFFGWYDGILRSYIDNEILLALAFFGSLFVASDFLNTPFQIFATFVIEEKFGFNKTTPRLFITDKLKGYLLTAIIGSALGWVFFWLVQTLGQSFWIYFLMIVAVFMLFMNMFYTSLILPLFNKLTPLEDGELKVAIHAYCEKVKFPLTNIFVIDGSKRTKKANAFFSGLGKKKKVILYDTLIENHTKEELLAIFAHEVGHFKKKHIAYGYVISIVQMALSLFILSLMVFNENLSLALGGKQMSIHLNLLAFGILYSPISHITGIFTMILSRKNEFEADAFASGTYNGNALKTALKKLSVDNLSNLYPHPAYVFFHYSHPPLLERVSAIEQVTGSKEN